MTFTQAALLTSWLAIALLTLAMAGLLRQVAHLSRVLSADQHSARSASGGSTPALRGLRLPASGPLAEILSPSEASTLIVFVSPGCRSCAQVLTALPLWRGDRNSGRDRQEVVIISSGACTSLPVPPGARCIPDGMTILERLGVPGTPYLMLIDQDGVIGDGLLAGDLANAEAFFRSNAENIDHDRFSRPVDTVLPHQPTTPRGA